MALSLILASHGLYAQEALKSVEMIIGTQHLHTEVISVIEGMTYDDALEKIQQTMASVKKDADEILILVDIFGGTPSNIASYMALTEENIQVYSGFNMPMLLELLATSPTTMEGANTLLMEAQKQSFVDISKKLKEGTENGNNMDSY